MGEFEIDNDDGLVELELKMEESGQIIGGEDCVGMVEGASRDIVKVEGFFSGNTIGLVWELDCDDDDDED